MAMMQPKSGNGDAALERVRAFARAVNGDLAANPAPAGMQAAQVGVQRAGLLGQPAPMGGNVDALRDLARQRLRSSLPRNHHDRVGRDARGGRVRIQPAGF